jgi:hypothetical protein
MTIDANKGIFGLGHEPYDIEPSGYQLTHARPKVSDSTITQVAFLIQ